MPERAESRISGAAKAGAKSKPVAKTQAEWYGELAHQAWERGQAAVARGDLKDGIAWLERAHRIAPDDPSVALSLAAPLLGMRDPRAAGLFELAATKTGQREAWIGLAASRFASGDFPAAADAVRATLGRHVVPDDDVIAGLFTNIASACEAPGWLGFHSDGTFSVRADERARAVFTVDGKPVRRLGAASAEWRTVSATIGGVHLIGSPLALAPLRRTAGVVVARDCGLEGWAWLPADPERIALLTVRSEPTGRTIEIAATGDAPPGLPISERGRSFRVAAAQLAGLAGEIRVTGADGADLLGSPLMIEAASAVPAAKLAPARRIAVVVPMHGNAALSRECLEAVERTMPAGTRIVAIDDATPEPALARLLDEWAGQRRIRLIRHRRNMGFPASANAGMRAALALPGKPDVLLLNSDALVTQGALERLRAAVQSAPGIGTATPFSNDATILSYPDRLGGNPVPSAYERRKIAVLAHRAGGGEVVDIPTAVGFCMYVRRECLEETGLFREDVFGQGYGEENDFCLRARALGWRNVAVPAAYVAHAGGQSFGAAKAHLIRRNLDILERLHPGYGASIADFQRRDPLAPARRRLDRLRFRPGRASAGAVVLVTHDSGGGVERVVRERCGALARDGFRAIVLRPVVDREAGGDAGRRYVPGLCAVSDGVEANFPNLVYRLPDEMPVLLALLRGEKPGGIEIHHMLGHDPSLHRLPGLLGIAPRIHIHDYASFCPRISLIGGGRRYCGEPVDAADCDACVADWGSNLEEDIGVAALRARSAAMLAAAAEVITPSADTALRIRRHFPASNPQVRPHEDDLAIPRPAFAPVSRLRIAVVGGIGVEKGYDVLLACARDAARRDLPMEFVVVGHTIDDARLFDTGRVFVTGPYKDDEVVDLIRAQDAKLAFLPSIWPETWCLTLGHAWRAGLFAAAFDIGAMAERIKATGFGWLLPLGLPAAGVNNALLAARPSPGDECAR